MIPRKGLYSGEMPRREDRRTTLEPVEGTPPFDEERLIQLEEVEGDPFMEDSEEN